MVYPFLTCTCSASCAATLTGLYIVTHLSRNGHFSFHLNTFFYWKLSNMFIDTCYFNWNGSSLANVGSSYWPSVVGTHGSFQTISILNQRCRLHLLYVIGLIWQDTARRRSPTQSHRPEWPTPSPRPVDKVNWNRAAVIRRVNAEVATRTRHRRCPTGAGAAARTIWISASSSPVSY